MEIIVNLLFLFFIGGVLGYILELTYRSVMEKHFINPGFLHGPFLPLYGFGLLILFSISNIPLFNINIIWLKVILRIILIFVSLTLIEYIAGIIFIKEFNIKLWDYSDQKGNIQGIICPLFSLVWGIIGTIFYFFINPLLITLLNSLNGNIILIFLMGIFLGILLMDFIFSMHIASLISKILKKLNLHIAYNDLKSKIKLYCQKHKLKHHFFLPFHKNIKAIEDVIKKD
jgi:uncharacterized membrane protein